MSRNRCPLILPLVRHWRDAEYPDPLGKAAARRHMCTCSLADRWARRSVRRRWLIADRPSGRLRSLFRCSLSVVSSSGVPYLPIDVRHAR